MAAPRAVARPAGLQGFGSRSRPSSRAAASETTTSLAALPGGRRRRPARPVAHGRCGSRPGSDRRAHRGGERIAIWGDYDADGMTAIAVWVLALRALGVEPIRYVPSRLADGYGLSAAGLRRCSRRGVTLVITCDCGVVNVAEVETRERDRARRHRHRPPPAAGRPAAGRGGGRPAPAGLRLPGSGPDRRRACRTSSPPRCWHAAASPPDGPGGRRRHRHRRRPGAHDRREPRHRAPRPRRAGASPSMPGLRALLARGCERPDSPPARDLGYRRRAAHQRRGPHRRGRAGHHAPGRGGPGGAPSARRRARGRSTSAAAR